MKSIKLFCGGLLVGVAFGMLIGIACVQGVDADVTKYAGVGSILAIAGVVIARSSSSTS